jgi:signal transduction histidine kinase
MTAMMDAKLTILIVDDRSSNIYALQTLLEKADREFRTAMNGPDALKIALNENIDLIILDVQMPEMDGFEVAQILQSHKRTKEIPIIFASAEKKERQSIIRGFEEGAVDYLSKPLDPELTRAKVSVLLKIQQQRRELHEKNLSLEKADNQIKDLNANLQKNLTQLESVNKELESFSYSVSHDLRAPLRSLIGYSKMLEEDYGESLGENGKKILAIINQNANRMNMLIDDLLEFARLGRAELKKSEVNTQQLVNNLIGEMKETLGSKVLFKMDSLLPVHADYPMFNQVWVNLISNAVKYSSKKQNPVIEIGSDKKDNEVIYHVADNGAGFSMEYAHKLFNVFQRLHTSTEFEGTGVGLALVHRIILKHGGKIWADAKVNEGATFYFALPLS